MSHRRRGSGSGRGCGCGMSTCYVCNPSDRCGTVTPPVDVPVDTPVNPPATSPKITLEDLLKLIDSKCDQTECDEIKEILGGNNGVEIEGNKIQTFVDVLDEDLIEKYPSAKLLKDELLLLWKCTYNRQKHHGKWEDNTVKSTLTSESGKCLLEGNNPVVVDTRIGVDAGDTVHSGFEVVRNQVTGTFDPVLDVSGEPVPVLWTSLVDNNITEPSVHGTETWMPLNYLKYAVCGNMNIWKFQSCQELEGVNESGIGGKPGISDNCPLVEGQIAMVVPPGESCFEIYRYTKVASDACIDPDGDACGVIVGNGSGVCYKWTSYSECHIGDGTAPATPYAINLVNTGSSYKLIMSDGNNHIAPYPTGMSSSLKYINGAEYAPTADADFKHVPMEGIIASKEAGGGAVTFSGGNAVVKTTGVYTVNLQMTHHRGTTKTGARATLTFGSANATHPQAISGFFALNAYNNTTNMYQQVTLNWTGLLNAGEPIATFVDAGADSVGVDENTLKIWGDDTRYTIITITKVGE